MEEEIKKLNLKELLELEAKEYTQEELNERAADTEIYYKKWGKAPIDLFEFEQLKYIGTKSQDLRDLWFGRGSINGLKLMREWFEKQTNQSKSRHDKEELEPELGEI